ncbi:MAG: aldo/keto reductase, partial [Spirochaetales bacterium]|nr:aldo/keto reductase [Spirochaetales bacterium]
PSGMGLLSGKYRKPEDLKDARKDLFCFREPCRRAFLILVDLVEEIAKKSGAECTDIALSWVKSKKPDIVILGARNTAQLKRNLEHRLVLTASELSDLDAAASELEKASRSVCENIFSYDW